MSGLLAPMADLFIGTGVQQTALASSIAPL
jgi:hypothetical protein